MAKVPAKAPVKKGRGNFNQQLRSDVIAQGVTNSPGKGTGTPDSSMSRASTGVTVTEMLNMIKYGEAVSLEEARRREDHGEDDHVPLIDDARFETLAGRGRAGRGGRTAQNQVENSTLREELFSKKRRHRTHVLVASAETQENIYACALRYSGPRPQRARNLPLRTFCLTAPSAALKKEGEGEEEDDEFFDDEEYMAQYYAEEEAAAAAEAAEKEVALAADGTRLPAAAESSAAKAVVGEQQQPTPPTTGQSPVTGQSPTTMNEAAIDYDDLDAQVKDTNTANSQFAVGIERTSSIEEASSYLVRELHSVLRLQDVATSNITLRCYLGGILGGYPRRTLMSDTKQTLCDFDEFVDVVAHDELKLFFVADTPTHVAEYLAKLNLERSPTIPEMQFELSFYVLDHDANVIVTLEKIEDNEEEEAEGGMAGGEILWKVLDVRSAGVNLSWQLHIFAEKGGIRNVIENALWMTEADDAKKERLIADLDKNFNHAITASLEMGIVGNQGMVTHDVLPFAKHLASQIVLKSSVTSSEFPLTVAETGDDCFILTKATMRHTNSSFIVKEGDDVITLNSVHATHYEMPTAATRHEDQTQVLTGRSASRDQKPVTIEERQWVFEWPVSRQFEARKNVRPVRPVMQYLQHIATGINAVRIETKITKEISGKR